MSGSTKPKNDSSGGSSTNSSDDVGMPEKLWTVGIYFSIFLLVFGISAMSFVSQLFSIGTLSVCIGLGIALTVFGTRAGGNFLRFNVAGGGATAILLYLVLKNFPINIPSYENYLIGEIFETSALRNVRGRAERVFLTGRISPGGNFRFIASEKEIGEGLVRFSFDQGPENEFFISCIKASDLKSAIYSQQISLTLEKESGGKFRLVQSNGRELGRMNEQNCTAPASAPSVKEVGFLEWFSIVAHAQQSTDLDVKKIIPLLESDDGDQRDRAREQLALLKSTQAMEDVTGSWKIKESSYRADLGRLVAWSATIDNDQSAATVLVHALSSEQINYVVQLTGQGDITLRQFATDLLHRLLETTSKQNGQSAEKSQDIVNAVLAVFAPTDINRVTKPSMSFSEENLIYNTIVAIGFTGCDIGNAYRFAVTQALVSLIDRLNQAGKAPKTAANAQKVLNSLKSCR